MSNNSRFTATRPSGAEVEVERWIVPCHLVRCTPRKSPPHNSNTELASQTQCWRHWK
jgi:hypothetical protein